MNPTNNSRRSYPQTPLLGASACIFDQEKVLLVLGARPPKQDLRSLPGGLVEVGETLQQAAARELLEETGVSANFLALADWVEVIKHGDAAIEYHFVIAMFVGQYSHGDILAGDDAAEAHWFEMSELSQLQMTKDTAELILKAHKGWIEGNF